MFGNAGVFAWFSFVKPFMVNVSGFSEAFMTVIMMLMGLGMVLGNMLSGKLSGRYSPLRIAATTDLVIVLSLVALFAFGEHKSASLLMGFICCAGLLHSLRHCKFCYCRMRKGRIAGCGRRAGSI